MKPPSLTELYLAWRQAKTALYFERRGVGLLELARYEAALPDNLRALQSCLSQSSWFDDVDIGEVWVVPKRLNEPPEDTAIVRIGGPGPSAESVLDVQLRLSPSPEFSIVEMLFLRRFGPRLDMSLSGNCVGYRLDLRHGELDATRRWTFEYWPKRYQEFRSYPLNRARAALHRSAEPVVVVSLDLASFYDSISPDFLISEKFTSELPQPTTDTDGEELQTACRSLLRAFGRFRQQASARLGCEVTTGVPIGSLTSRLVANLSLSTLDRHVETNPEVLSYRRYVDDLVVVARSTDEITADSVLSTLLPLNPAEGDEFRLDVVQLDRPGCEFAIQRQKLRVHHLSGEPGEDFVEAVLADFDQMVSRSQAFIDPVALVDDGATHLIRAREGEGSPLRVLRDADRTRLERWALSTSLRTLERASTLLDPAEAQRVVRTMLRRVGRVLRSESDWVESLEPALRLLRLAVSTRDWESARTLNDRFEKTFGSTEAVQASIGTLRYRGRLLPPGRRSPWTWLRNYLHARRLEAVASSMQPDMSQRQLAGWAGDGLMVRTRTLGAVALGRRAADLSWADLRTKDREDDLGWSSEATDELFMDSDMLPELAERFDEIGLFLRACRTLGDRPWLMSPARLFLSTRPPSYFDVARRLMYRAESPDGFPKRLFEQLLGVVNALRGTRYRDPIGTVKDPQTVELPWAGAGTSLKVDVEAHVDPVLVLGNLVAEELYWKGAATRAPSLPHGRPVHTTERLLGLTRVIRKATSVARSQPQGVPTLLVLPELSIPRRWFRTLAWHIVRFGGFGAVMGLEYLHDPKGPFVVNQAFAVIPGPFNSVASWPWTKRWPADGERRELASLPSPMQFKTRAHDPPRVVVETVWGRFSTLICSEIIEARRVADLLGRAELVLCPAWNTDTASYDHLIQSVGFQLHAIIAVANNGYYSDCRAWAPLSERWKRDLCRLVERGVDDVVHVALPMGSLIRAHGATGDAVRSKCPEGCEPKKPEWRPLPPNWPSRTGGSNRPDEPAAGAKTKDENDQ